MLADDLTKGVPLSKNNNQKRWVSGLSWAQKRPDPQMLVENRESQGCSSESLPQKLGNGITGLLVSRLCHVGYFTINRLVQKQVFPSDPLFWKQDRLGHALSNALTSCQATCLYPKSNQKTNSKFKRAWIFEVRLFVSWGTALKKSPV